MDERKEAGGKEAGQPDLPPRKPWHAPQFVITSLSSTDAVCNGMYDGALVGNTSS
jgi:hypothetical protein